MIFAFPCGRTTSRRPDEAFAYEYATAIGCDHDIMLFDPDELVITRSPFQHHVDDRVVCMRTKQLSRDGYRDLCHMLEEKEYVPLTVPHQYMASASAEFYFGYIPKWLTIGAFTLPYPDCLDVDKIRDGERRLTTTPEDHRLFVKDYLKSVPEHSVIDATGDDDGIISELEALIQARGDAFSGGVAFKDYHADLQDEYRFVLVNEKVVVTGEHGHGPRTGMEPPSFEIPLSVNPPSLFYTVDVAYSPSLGKWFVVELNDGQVSTMPGKQGVYEMFSSTRWTEAGTRRLKAVQDKLK